MDERSVLRVLTQYDVDYKYTTPDGWAMCSCPLAPYKLEHRRGTDSKPSFGVHIDEDDVSRYHCFTCHARGTIGGLGMLLGKFREEPDLTALGKKVDHDDIIGGGVDYEFQEGRGTKDKAAYRNKTFPSERGFEEQFPRTLAIPAATAYLRRRGISAGTAFSLGLRFDPRQKRILFPVYDYWTGAYAGCSGRSILSAALLDSLEQRTGRPQPKVRDYHGLEKDKLLLGTRRGILRKGHVRGLPHSRRRLPYENGGGYAIGVEGLFAFARMVERGYGHSTVGLLGSELLEGKALILEDIGLPVFWFTDNDPAGLSCLYGRTDEEGEYKGGAALDRLYHSVAQFVPTWPDDKDDPDDLTKDEIVRMIDEAELYAHG